MVSKQGVQAAPDTKPLSEVMAGCAKSSPNTSAPRGGGRACEAADGAASAGGAPGQIRSREDAIRCLEAVTEFFGADVGVPMTIGVVTPRS